MSLLMGDLKGLLIKRSDSQSELFIHCIVTAVVVANFIWISAFGKTHELPGDDHIQ